MTDPRIGDDTVFPDQTYRETVLAPLFEDAKQRHVNGFRRIDRAHLVMLHATGILPDGDAGAIATALAAIDSEIDPKDLVYTGEVEDYFFLVERELKTRLGADLGGRLHTARSRNDIDHTLFKLALRERVDVLLTQARELLAALLEAAERDRATPVVAYTHGQPAQPTSFGHYLSAVIEVLIRDIERVEAARTIVDLSPLGSAAITTSGFPIDRQLTARLLGFSAPLQNSYGGIAAVDYITATYGALELLFLHLGRPIQDFQFWTAFEVGQLYVPNSLVQISSIMPQKRNPVPIEHLRHLASQTFGRARAVLDIVHNTPFTDMNDSEGETQAFGHEAFVSGGRVLRLLATLIAAIRVDDARVAENINRSCITITELADTLVREEGLSFRQAHEIAAHTARAVVATRGNLVDNGFEPFAVSFREATGRDSVIDPKHFAQVVSAEHFIKVRERFGGPGPGALDAALVGYRSKLERFSEDAATRQSRLQAAGADLETQFSNLLRSA